MLEDGRGELLFGRPIRWMLFLYGGRVVPFTIAPDAGGADRPGAGRHVRRRHLRPPVPDDQRPRRPRDQGAIVRRVPRAAARELRHPRAQRAAQQDRARARREGAAAAGPRQPHRAQRVGPAAGSARSGRVPVGRRRHVRARVPRAAGRSADDDADSPSALLSGRRRGRQAEERVSRRHQHRAGQRADDRAQRRARGHRAAARRAVLLGSRSEGAARIADRPARHAAVSQEARHLQGEGRADRAAGAVDRRRGASAPTTTAARHAATAARLAKADLDDRHGARVHRAAGDDGRHLRARGGAARGGLEGDLLPLPADRRRGRRAADDARSWARRR